MLVAIDRIYLTGEGWTKYSFHHSSVLICRWKNRLMGMFLQAFYQYTDLICWMNSHKGSLVWMAPCCYTYQETIPSCFCKAEAKAILIEILTTLKVSMLPVQQNLENKDKKLAKFNYQSEKNLVVSNEDINLK